MIWPFFLVSAFVILLWVTKAAVVALIVMVGLFGVFMLFSGLFPSDSVEENDSDWLSIIIGIVFLLLAGVILSGLTG